MPRLVASFNRLRRADARFFSRPRGGPLDLAGEHDLGFEFDDPLSKLRGQQLEVVTDPQLLAKLFVE